MRIRSFGGVLLGLLCAATPALAQNLVVNGGFAADTSSWASYGSGSGSDGARTWDPSDSDGTVGSGSALMTISSTAASGTVIGLSQCIDISTQAALSTYQFFASVNGTVPQNLESRAIVEAEFYSDTACTTSLNTADGQGGLESIFPASAAPWATVPTTASAGGNEVSVTAPAGANGLQVRVYLERTGGSSQQTMLFDSVVLHNATTTPILLTTFAAE